MSKIELSTSPFLGSRGLISIFSSQFLDLVVRSSELDPIKKDAEGAHIFPTFVSFICKRTKQQAMASQGRIRCKHCNRRDFRTEKGLNHHLNHSACKDAHIRETFGTPTQRPPLEEEEPDSDEEGPEVFMDDPGRPERPSFLQRGDILQDDLDAIRGKIGLDFATDSDTDDDNSTDNEDAFYLDMPGLDEDGFSSSTEGSFIDDLRSAAMCDSDDDDQGPPEVIHLGPNEDEDEEGPITEIRDQFLRYIEDHHGNTVALNKNEKRSIRLLAAMRKKKVALNGYNEVMEWHLKESGLVRDHESAAASKHFIGREVMLDRLKERYNYKNKFPFQKRVKLPTSGAVVKITCHDVGYVIQQLLTDPRIQDSDYLFFDDDPRAPPPENITKLKDLTTGTAFRDTHKIMINPEKGEQLFPLPVYIDGAHISNFHDLELIQVRTAIGLWNLVTRRQEWAWGIIGYIEKVHEQGGVGRDIWTEGNHMEYQDGSDTDDHSSAAESIFGIGKENVEDLHAMIGVIFQSMAPIQKRGFMWDMPYKGTIYRNIHFKIFIPFVKCDNTEADKLCGKYQMRTGNVAQICRCCHIPLAEANDHLHKPKPKTVPEISNLVAKGKTDGLQAISQTYLINGFHKLRFNMGNTRGIHGACPADMLHSIQLGIFKYLRDIFFRDLGATSKTAKAVNGIAKVYCRLLKRQSDRSVPKCTFSRGIQEGRLMGREYRGVLLIMCAILRSTGGRRAMAKSRKGKFSDDVKVDDWILLVETLLQWEAYLCSEEMYLKDVKKLEKKNRFIMFLMRRIASRTVGMGLRILKFHIIIHLVTDMLMYGIALEFDTAANEGHHKLAKQGARLTQKAATTFNLQTAHRMTEFRLLDLALLEIEEGKVLWNYFDGCVEEGDESSSDEAMEREEEEEEGVSTGASVSPMEEEESSTEEEESSTESDASLDVYTGETGLEVGLGEYGELVFKVISRSKYKLKTRLNEEVLRFLYDLQVLVSDHLDDGKLPIFTYHRRGTQIFRGHPNYRGKGAWRDWVWVNFGADGRFPCHIWCFVKLDGLPKGRNAPHYGGIQLKGSGVYAVVESARVEEDKVELGRSSILTPIRKEVDLNPDGTIKKRYFYLADTSAFVEPCCCVGDVGGPPNRYFLVKARERWCDDFVRWLRDPHGLDEMEALDVNDKLIEIEEDSEAESD